MATTAFPAAEGNEAPTAPRTYLNYIGGQWRPSLSGETFDNTNPARQSELIGTFQRSTAADVDAAVAAAEAALPAWCALPAPARGEIILRAALLLEQRQPELARQMTREMGKPLKETIGDVRTAIDFGKYVAGEGRRAEGETVPSALPDKMCLTVRQPLGVVGIITPWNFPMAIPAWKTLPALLAGNTVVLKPASDTPLSAVNLVEILSEAGLPAGVLNLVTGPGATLGDALVTDPRVAMISLTGSTEVGRHVAELCGRDLRRCSLELGGKNAVIVMDDADLDEAVAAVSWAGFGTTGQRCTATSRVIIHERVASAFAEKLVATAEKLRIGDGLLAETDMGPLVNAGRVQAVHAYTEIGVSEGARLLTGGRPLTDDELAGGAFYAPTVFTDATTEMRIAQEEVFGPFVTILPVRDYDEAIGAANATIYGLSCAIFTENARTAFRAMRDINAGLIYINAGTTGAEPHLPFGGTKQSGNGHRELGRKAVEEFSEIKTVFVSYPARSPRG
ncbi:MAG: aldehyde dehydrogenase family protein [Ktedonobacterales bacterium]|nr:aldehyde dehydrogenase family protein [Ktedonobacterales bacterium]